MAPVQLERGPSPDRFAVYALQFARRTGVRSQHFAGDDTRSQDPHDTGYFIWLAASSTTTVVVDAGLDPRMPQPLSGFDFVAAPTDLLAAIGKPADEVDHLVLTHLHYDHTGTARCFRRAHCVLQRAEFAHWNDPSTQGNPDDAWLHQSADLDHVRDRLDLVDGDHELVPGISAHLVGGHTPGMQIVRVTTASDPVVIASDASHFYENLDENRPSPIVHNTAEAIAAFARIRELAGPAGVVLPGHDPEVLRRHQPTGVPHVVRVR